MRVSMDDCVKNFFDFYVKGDLQSAVSQIIPSPDFSYDRLQSPDNLLQQLVNFTDASIFGKTQEAKFQNAILGDFITFNAKKFEAYSEAFELLKLEKQFLTLLSEKDDKDSSLQEKIPPFFQRLLIFQKEKDSLENIEIEQILTQVPEKFRVLMKFHLMMTWGWQKFKNSKPLFISNFSKKYSELHPWYPLQYTLPIPSLETCPLDKIPIIFFEPVKDDLSQFLQQLEKRPAIFAFTTVSNFFQMLQFPVFADSLAKPEHLVYILELYPNQQFASQDLEFIKDKELHPIFFAPMEPMKTYAPVLIQALKECMEQPKNELNFDTPIGNWVYEIAKRLLLSIQQDRLGLSRAPALHMHLGQMKWYESHKGHLPQNKPLGPEVNDLMKIILSSLAKKRVARARTAKGKLLLAHIVPQIVYGGHAPSRILENLVLNHDPENFEVIVVCTELLKEFFLEYPYNFYTSPSSKLRGGPIIYKFQQIGVKTIINEKAFLYVTNATDLARLLKDYRVDVAVFHGPDIINTMTAQMVDVPLRVLFEHGSQSAYPGFDLAVLSSETAAELYHDLYKKINTQVIALPFAVDMRKEWLLEPSTRESLGLPEDCMIMTTISTKLDVRLTDEMCHTIAEILKRVPKACYAPIGEIRKPERIKKIFAEYGVADRFYPLGNAKTPPSHMARSMHLYLNEFPFGGCLAILDAMAAGCPVVTMYDEEGPQQARYGGNFMGIDRAISSGDKEGYIELACKLLTDLKMYKEWSRHASSQYEKFADVKSYVRSFESIILGVHT